MNATTDETTVCGCQVQIDHSGQGHCWRNAAANDIPANIRDEIAGEMIDGGRGEAGDCSDFIASNGCHYRW
jgi:hypothetical protein